MFCFRYGCDCKWWYCGYFFGYIRKNFETTRYPHTIYNESVVFTCRVISICVSRRFQHPPSVVWLLGEWTSDGIPVWYVRRYSMAFELTVWIRISFWKFNGTWSMNSTIICSEFWKIIIEKAWTIVPVYINL